jgi:predicted deacylase
VFQFFLIAGITNVAHSGPAEPPSSPPPPDEKVVIGQSAQGREITAYWYGQGPRWVALVGGLHGGYEWNTTLLAYQMSDYLAAHPEALPAGVRVAVIPAANPDGLAATVGRAGRFRPQEARLAGWAQRLNANKVDLNRNWDCDWQPQGRWRAQTVSGGKAPFSEPETQALRDFLTQPQVAAVVFWHSAAGWTLAGGCGERLKAGDALAQVYADASGYVFQQNFSPYPVHGAAADWLAGQGIPSIDVELRNHQDTDWERNLKGVQALIRALVKK